MSYVKPDAVLEQMAQAGATTRLAPSDLLVRGFLRGAAGLRHHAGVHCLAPDPRGPGGRAGLPGGLCDDVLLGLELVTGNFAPLPLAVRERRIGMGSARQLGLVFVGNLAGSVFYAWLFTLTVAPDSEMAAPAGRGGPGQDARLREARAHGMAVAVAKAILCNWMVTLGVVMALTSQSTEGRSRRCGCRSSRSSRRASSTPS